MRTTLTIALVITSVFITHLYSQVRSNRLAADITYVACELSRTADAILEQDCADMQDKHGLRYSCALRNNSLNNNCRVEMK